MPDLAGAHNHVHARVIAPAHRPHRAIDGSGDKATSPAGPSSMKYQILRRRRKSVESSGFPISLRRVRSFLSSAGEIGKISTLNLFVLKKRLGEFNCA